MLSRDSMARKYGKMGIIVKKGCVLGDSSRRELKNGVKLKNVIIRNLWADTIRV